MRALLILAALCTFIIATSICWALVSLSFLAVVIFGFSCCVVPFIIPIIFRDVAISAVHCQSWRFDGIDILLVLLFWPNTRELLLNLWPVKLFDSFKHSTKNWTILQPGGDPRTWRPRKAPLHGIALQSHPELAAIFFLSALRCALTSCI